jgi:hypothetical protein
LNPLLKHNRFIARFKSVPRKPFQSVDKPAELYPRRDLCHITYGATKPPDRWG